MTIYKEKLCTVCGLPYLPTSPKQKFCISCKDDGRKITDRVRDKKRSRIKNNYIEELKKCKACSVEFLSFYKKKCYCGSKECEEIRKKIKSKKADKKRHYRLRQLTKIRQIFNKNKKVNYIVAYIEQFGYKVLNSDNYINSHIGKLELLCPSGHVWWATFHAFKDLKARCFTCYVAGNYVSRPEQKIRDYFTTNHPELEIVYNDRKQIYPKELDLYFPSQKVAIEVCGLYWHSEENGKPTNYHYNKMDLAYKKGIRLITIFEDEIRDKLDIVISRILQALHLTPNKIFARKCVVKDIENKEANLFLDKNHIQGRSNSTKSFGLFYNDELVSVATVGKINRKHTSTGDTIELKRFCTLNNTMVIGGAQKLFKYIKEFVKNDGYTIIKSYCCMRYANIFNPVYENMGFILSGHTKYSPHYIKNGIRYRNFSLRKTPEERLLGKTESQLRAEQGYDRVWDCGHRTYVYLIN